MPLNKAGIQRHATLQQFRDFRDSVIYRDIESEIYAWLDDIAAQLEIAEKYEDIKQLQGSAKACRNLLNLVDIIISQMEAEQE